ncbi:MAG TPA: heparinase II/III family protein [Caulobacteraceae bacterium]|jgi:uncharacterized heparinase superfamily protein
MAAGERARLWLPALGRTLVQQARSEWFGAPLHRLALGQPKALSLSAAPRDVRPTDLARGEALLAGSFTLAGETLEVGPGGDPWNRPSPSHAFAERLHRFDWIGDLTATGGDGVRDALQLTQDWKRVFGRWNGFSWRPDLLERRVFNLACVAQTLVAPASEWETGQIADTLARQARHLLRIGDEPPRAAERLVACAVAGIALGGAAGEHLLTKALPRLDRALAAAVLPDGGHASRSPQAGLELLFDLLALDDGLARTERPSAERVSRAIDRLTEGVRFFTLPDRRLASFQGGEAGDVARIAAAMAQDAAGTKATPLRDAPFSGYQRMAGHGRHGPAMTVMVDTGPAAAGAWSLSACAQTGAIEIVCGRDRLIANCGWGPLARGPQTPRRSAGASAVSLDEGSVGVPLEGYLARALGARLVDTPARVTSHRHESEAGVWVEINHDGWASVTGLTHERRLYLDKDHNELRGEDRFMPAETARAKPVAVAIRFHLPSDVRALVSRDQRSVLLRGPSNIGWWLRSDASEVVIDSSVNFRDGIPYGASQIVLRGRLRADRGGRVRWKLAVAETAPAA